MINPLPLIGVLIGILIFRPLKGGGVINHGSTLTLKTKPYSEDQGDLVSRLVRGRTMVAMWIIGVTGVINLPTKSP